MKMGLETFLLSIYFKAMFFILSPQIFNKNEVKTMRQSLYLLRWIISEAAALSQQKDQMQTPHTNKVKWEIWNFTQEPASLVLTHIFHYFRFTVKVRTDPDGERSVFAANSAAAIWTAGFWRAAVLLFLLKNLWVEFLQRNKPDPSVHRHILGEGFI